MAWVKGWPSGASSSGSPGKPSFVMQNLYSFWRALTTNEWWDSSISTNLDVID